MTFSAKQKEQYLQDAARTRAKRMEWWHKARFGMFVHWGLYAQLGRHEWVMNRERIPLRDYEKLAKTWKPKPRAAREWARLAKAAGMKYMVMTTKHHEGFCLWDTQQHDYNAARQGPGRDLVREYVQACREFGLKVGFYYSLMDWHHADGARCASDEAARKRFVEFTRACVRELLTNYGKIDILWYDVSWPLQSPEAWGSYETNAMARELQPHILINNRSQLDEDFGTPEEHIQAAEKGRAWEACMTFNGSWGWQPCPPEDWHSVRSVLNMLRTCTAGGGNLLLNIGPKPDGSVPEEATERLTRVGQWLRKYGNMVYGDVDRVEKMEWMPTGNWTRKGKTFYFWATRWPGRQLAIGGLSAKLRRARLFPGGKPLPFEQTSNRLVIRGLPAACPDRVASVAPIEMEFERVPAQTLGAGYVLLKRGAVGPGESEMVGRWQVSSLMPKGQGIAKARCVRLSNRRLRWRTMEGEGHPACFVNVNKKFGSADGIAYLGNRFKADQDGSWTIHVRHDGGIRLFVDGKAVLTVPQRVNPAYPRRSSVSVPMRRGLHEIVVALDTDHGMGWGMYFNFEVPASARKPGAKLRFPKRVR